MLGSLFFYIDIVAIVPFYIGIIVAPLDFAEDSTWVVGGDDPNPTPTPTPTPTLIPTATPDPDPTPNQVGGNGEDSGNTILKLLNLLRIIRIFKVTWLGLGLG